MKVGTISQQRRYWDEVIKKIEDETFRDQKRTSIELKNNSELLSSKLRKRIAKIVPRNYDKAGPLENFLNETSEIESSILDENFSSADFQNDDAKTLQKRQRYQEQKLMSEVYLQYKDIEFTESQCSEICQKQYEMPHINIKIEKPIIADKIKSDKYWMTDYICKQRKDRVIWGSLLYPQERTFKTMSMEEQASYLMETCSHRFADSINAWGLDKTRDIPRGLIKQLFSVEPEQLLANSISINSKEIKATSRHIAEKWQVPEMAIETKYEKLTKKRCKPKTKLIIRHAFGRTIPEKEQQWTATFSNKPITTFFPSELIDGEMIFKGIGHLRSVKKFVEFCIRNPIVKKPKFLIHSGHFKEKRVAALSIGHQPLYERLNLKF